MRLTASLGLVTALLAFAPGRPAAQTLNRGGIGLTTGIARVDRRDDNASPVRYGGMGPMIEMVSAVRRERWSFTLRLGSSFTKLSSAITRGDPHEDDNQGWLDFEVRYGTRWRFGGMVRNQVAVWTHVYGPPTNEPVRFSSLSTVVAPALSWQRARPKTTIDVRLAVPVLAFVSRAYSDERVAASDPTPARIQPLGAVQGLDLQASLRVALGRRWDFTLVHRFALQRYDRESRLFRLATHGLSVGVAWVGKS